MSNAEVYHHDPPRTCRWLPASCRLQVRSLEGTIRHIEFGGSGVLYHIAALGRVLLASTAAGRRQDQLSEGITVFLTWHTEEAYVIPSRRKFRMRSPWRGKRLWTILLVLPGLVVVSVFVFVPLAGLGVMSVSEGTGGLPLDMFLGELR